MSQIGVETSSEPCPACGGRRYVKTLEVKASPSDLLRSKPIGRVCEGHCSDRQIRAAEDSNWLRNVADEHMRKFPSDPIRSLDYADRPLHVLDLRVVRVVWNEQGFGAGSSGIGQVEFIAIIDGSKEAITTTRVVPIP